MLLGRNTEATHLHRRLLHPQTYREINSVTSMTIKTPSVSHLLSGVFNMMLRLDYYCQKCSWNVWLGGGSVRESRETLHDECVCEGWGGGEQRTVWCGWGLFFLSLFSPLCFQLEAHPDFVSAGVEVLPVDQGGEGHLHTCRHEPSKVRLFNEVWQSYRSIIVWKAQLNTTQCFFICRNSQLWEKYSDLLLKGWSTIV